MAKWYDSSTIQNVWREARTMHESELDELLAVAREECEEFAYPEDVADPSNIPARVALAHRLHAQAIWNSQKTSGRDDDVTLSGQSVTVYPMDWQVKNHLRPKRGVPAVG